MKRLALLLGSLLVVTAAASAKEVVPAPVVVEEAPVQVVEKEVIVYRDKEEGFRPNGFVDAQYRYYGNAENDTAREAKWAGDNNTSRMQLTAKVNMTENQTFEARIRDYNSLDQASTYLTDENSAPAKSVVAPSTTETRLRYWYNHGPVGASKVNLASRVHFENTAGSQNVEYSARFDFADYLFNNDFVKTNTFEIAPKVGYKWGDGNDSNYENQVGVDLASTYTLPAGFSAELNVYGTQKFYGQDQKDSNGKYQSDNFDLYVEFYLYNTTNLYTNGNYAVDFVFEGGVDGYDWSQEKVLTKTTGNETYSLYAFPALQLSYQATDFVKLYAQAGAEYRNHAIESAHSARNWRWQPVATVGFTTTF